MIFPSLNLSKEECSGALRRLELETYSHLISVFRAQGCLNNEKFKILEEMRRLLFITEERHRGEARRAANDEYLSTIANIMCGPNSELQWLKEGRRLFPLLNRKPPLSSLINVANNAVKYSLNKKKNEILKKTDDKKLNMEKLDENCLRNQYNKSTNNFHCEVQCNKSMEALKKLYTLSKNFNKNQHETIIMENSNVSLLTNVNTHLSGELDLQCHKIDNSEVKSSILSKQMENKLSINRTEIDKLIVTPNNTMVEKSKFIIVDNEISKTSGIGNVKLVGNILNVKRKSSEKMSEVTDITPNKYIKAEIVKDLNEIKCLPTVENLVNTTKLKTNQSTVAIQKIVNPFAIENVKLPSSAIQLKDIQNRKAVKLITAPNGKIFIQPVQGSANRISNIQPLTTVFKSNQCIELKKVTSLGAVSEIQPKPIKISKPNMIILPKTPLSQKQSEEENTELVTNKKNLSNFSISSCSTNQTIQSVASSTTTSSISNPVTKSVTSFTNHLPNQSNVFIIGSVINQNLTRDQIIDDIHDIDNDIGNEKDLITEDTPVDIMPTSIEEIYKTEAVKIISNTTNSIKPESIRIANNTQFTNNEQQNISIFSATDWELELDQEAAQRNKERNNSEEDNFNSVIEEVVEEATEDSFSEFEDCCQYDDASSS